ncbi:hypothetical protein QYM36_019757, partial [Artemia franciscana]
GHDIRFFSFDITKAFCPVWHKKLLCKLKAYGIYGLLFEVNECRLSSPTIIASCPRWLHIKRAPSVIRSTPKSILWPTLLLAFISDLGDDLVEKPHYFPDDTTTKTLIAKDKGPSEPHRELQAHLERIEAWTDAWVVSLNGTKTKELRISKKRDMRVHPDFVFKGDIAS